ncbi:hypothetical protein CJ197_00805 [Brachybacterium sp. UMB0905]|nr:hypothetical protein CJ197_00805 [Brachybacterium sp. UMB0905]
MLGMLLLIGAALILLIRGGSNLAGIIGAEEQVAADAGGDLGAVGLGTGLISILLSIANFVVSLAVLVIGVITAIMGRGRARLGGILAAVIIVLAPILFFIGTFLMGMIGGITGMIDPNVGVTAGALRVILGVDLLRVLFVAAMIGLGGWFARSTAQKNLSA